MGWLVYDKPSNVKAHLDSGWSEGYTMIASALKGFTYYAAIRDDESGDVVAAVTLVRYYRDGTMGTKHMDDAMGPCERECPANILDLLTPTDHQYAQEWRAECRENLRKRAVISALKKGEVFKLKKPLKFTNGSVHEEFEVVRKTRHCIVAIPTCDFYEVSITRRALMDNLAALDA